MHEQWTIETVKDLLPDVNVRLSSTGQVIPGQVTGRKERFAVVYIDLPINGELAIPYAWKTIVRSLNTGTPLRA